MIFERMVNVVRPVEVGRVRVEHFVVPKSNLGAIYYGGDAPAPGKYARLMIGDTLWMSDTWFEHRLNAEAVDRAHGAVLIGGLGLGMVALAIARKATVTRVTVVERDADVVAAVEPQIRARLPSRQRAKLTVVVADVCDWTPPGRVFNVVYLDIWPDLCTDYLADMTRLSRKYRACLDRSDPDRWVGCWGRERLRWQREQERARGW